MVRANANWATASRSPSSPTTQVTRRGESKPTTSCSKKWVIGCKKRAPFPEPFLFFSGVPTGIRTPVSTVKERRSAFAMVRNISS